MSVDKDELQRRFGGPPLRDALTKQGVDPDYLAEKLKEELEALRTRIVKVKGVVDGRTKLAKGTGPAKIIGGTTGIMGESLVAIDEVDWNTRARARMDAQKALDLYPAEKHEHNISGELTIEKLIEDVDGNSTRPPHLRED